MALLMHEPASFWWWTAVVIELAGLALIPHVLLHKRNPLSALSWLWALLLFPVVAPIFYLVFGTERMQRKRLRRRKHSPARDDTVALTAVDAPRLPQFAERLLRVSGRNFSADNRLDLIADSAQFYEAIGRAVDAARCHVHLEFFIWKDDAVGRPLSAALARAAARGVEVRLLLDAVGCLSLSMSAFTDLRAAGGKVSWFSTANPFRQRWFLHLRNHRKLAVLDGAVAFVGGMNVGEDYLAWRDLHSRLEGPAVTELQGVFADDWYFATTEALTSQVYYPVVRGKGDDDALVLAAGPDQEFSANAIRITLLALMEQRLNGECGSPRPIWSRSAITAALQLCARSGVDTRSFCRVTPTAFTSATSRVPFTRISWRPACAFTNTFPACCIPRRWWWTTNGA